MDAGLPENVKPKEYIYHRLTPAMGREHKRPEAFPESGDRGFAYGPGKTSPGLHLVKARPFRRNDGNEPGTRRPRPGHRGSARRWMAQGQRKSHCKQ
jgi:hypothetical protein